MAERLCGTFGSSVVAIRSLAELREAGLKRSARVDAAILCSDEIRDLSEVLELLGNSCFLNRCSGKNPLPVTLLSAERNPSIDHDAVHDAAARFPLSIGVRSVPLLAARRLLRRFPLHLSVDPLFGQVVHVLIVGVSELGLAIALQAMRLAHYGTGRPLVTIASLDPGPERARFLAEFPEARGVAQIEFVELDLSAVKSDIAVTSVYLCGTETIDPGLRIKSIREALFRLQTTCPPIFLELPDDRTSADISGWDGQTYPFNALSEVCEAGVLFGDSEDELAAVIHDYYRDSIAAQGRALAGNPAAEVWERLEESYRQASRHQADHMAAKVAAIDCRFVPEQESEFFVFFPREVERLARIEHDRWSADRHLNGWKYGPVRDNQNKIHPELIPFDALSEDMKDLDRYTVRLMPALLGRRGMAIRRNLIVAARIVGSCDIGEDALRSLHHAFGRLADRSPDRSLVLAIDLGDFRQGLLARFARDKFGAAVWSLIGEPLHGLLSRAESERTRIECLETLAYSERRICVPGHPELEKWVESRADVALILDRLEPAVRSGVARNAAPGPRKRVVLDPETGMTRWSFEY